jgi:hypothetical protein
LVHAKDKPESPMTIANAETGGAAKKVLIMISKKIS